jgi:FkbM family methyltransferase
MPGSYESTVSWRRWKRCEFNSIGPVDQIIFSLLGGKVDQLGTRCATWDFPGDRCSCAAPLGLLGKARTVVEIGANDGLHMSNSRFFERQLGWRSLCVEANPQLYKSLKVNRPNCINVNTLVGRRSDFNGSSTVPYIAFSPGQNRSRTFREWQTGLSGIESTHATNNEITSFRRARGFAKRNGLEVERHLLPVAQFSQLFAKHGIDKIDLLSVDVEGAEDTVVQSINFQAVRIGMIVIEKPSLLVTNLLIRNQFRPLGIVTGSADQFFLNKHWHEKYSPNERQVAADRHQTSSQVDATPTTITVGQWSWQLDATHREIGIGVIVTAVAFSAIVIACALVLI